jgi:hypothetical protein
MTGRLDSYHNAAIDLNTLELDFSTLTAGSYVSFDQKRNSYDQLEVQLENRHSEKSIEATLSWDVNGKIEKELVLLKPGAEELLLGPNFDWSVDSIDVEYAS